MFFVSGRWENSETSSFFTRGVVVCRALGRIFSSILALTRWWSVQYSAPLIARTLCRSCRSRQRTIIYSLICQCLERGCCHVPLYLFFVVVFFFLTKSRVSNDEIVLVAKLQNCKSCLPFLIHMTLNISKFENPSSILHSNHQVEWSYHHQEYWEIVVLTHHKRSVCLFQGSPWLGHKLTRLWQNVSIAEGDVKK